MTPLLSSALAGVGNWANRWRLPAIRAVREGTLADGVFLLCSVCEKWVPDRHAWKGPTGKCHWTSQSPDESIGLAMEQIGPAAVEFPVCVCLYLPGLPGCSPMSGEICMAINGYISSINSTIVMLFSAIFFLIFREVLGIFSLSTCFYVSSSSWQRRHLLPGTCLHSLLSFVRKGGGNYIMADYNRFAMWFIITPQWFVWIRLARIASWHIQLDRDPFIGMSLAVNRSLCI